MIHYIDPEIIRHENIDNLLKNEDRRSFGRDKNNISIDDIINANFACVVGEPGIGKTRLTEEIAKRKKERTYCCKAIDFEPQNVPLNINLCIIDALDEVEGARFQHRLKSIIQYWENNPKIHIVLTCRKHYIASYGNLISSCKDLLLFELTRLNESDVSNIINGLSDEIKKCIYKSKKLLELLRIPRYLNFLLELENERTEFSNISHLFDYIIEKSIYNALSYHKDLNSNENFKILIKRVLEKVALVMEISRTDQITKDELYTILDGVKGNMPQLLIANFDLLFFESRILKDTNGILQFENSEIQEYLAAKELCRHDNIESILYDIAIQKELKHIYPNWFDVIPHLSYMENGIASFINIVNLIISYESHLENESFVSLLRYIDPILLSHSQKDDLFSVIFKHYLIVPSYVYSGSPILNLLAECYSFSSDNMLKTDYKSMNKIQLSNISSILNAINEHHQLALEIYEHWQTAATWLFDSDNQENQITALDLYYSIKASDSLISLSQKFNSFTTDVREQYFEVTGHLRISDFRIIDCWIKGCFSRNPYAINAILGIEEPTAICYAYKKIIESDKLNEFFNPSGNLAVFYEIDLRNQFEIAKVNGIESKKIITKIIAGFVNEESYNIDNNLTPVIRQILLDHEIACEFIAHIRDKWDLERLIGSFEVKLIDFDLIHSLDMLIDEKKVEPWFKEHVLRTLTFKIKDDVNKKDSIKEYIELYVNTITLEYNNSLSNKKYIDEQHSKLNYAYESLSDKQIQLYKKFKLAYDLSKDLKFIDTKDPNPLIDIIETFFASINIDEIGVTKKSDNTFNISSFLCYLPNFVRVIHHLCYNELLIKYRLLLAKTFPTFITSINSVSEEIKDIYKQVIGNLNVEEKDNLVEWWKLRKDDFLNIRPDNIFTCITEFGIDALSFKLEEYIDEYVIKQDNGLSYTASKALNIIAYHLNIWDLRKYITLFGNLKDNSINGLKMQCNAIMIEKYQYKEAIKWRIDYLKENIFKSKNIKTRHARPISIEESEVMSSNPKMFRCFMFIQDNSILVKEMFDLFDFGLSLSNDSETKEYSRYILSQVYMFFIQTNNLNYISELRKMVETFNSKKVCYLANDIMFNAELMYLRNEKGSIDRAIKLYNRCIDAEYLGIRNDNDLIRYFSIIQGEIQKEIQDQGIYSLLKQDLLTEDFIQRELKNTIMAKCCQLGLGVVSIDREVALQDNKRTDILIRYHLCRPIMIELKLLHNDEIQNSHKRQVYQRKFIQYRNATNACLSVFWVFNVGRRNSDVNQFEKLKDEYKELADTRVILTDCKCSCGHETGILEKRKKKKENSLKQQ